MAENATAAGGLELRIDAREHGGKQEIPLHGTFQVILTNRSGHEVRIWEDGNSWGYGALSFELSKPSGGKATVRKKERDWRKNTPSFWVIGNGQSHSYDVSLGSEEWEALPKGLVGQSVGVRAILEIRPDDQTKEFGVWTGKVASPAGQYVLR